MTPPPATPAPPAPPAPPVTVECVLHTRASTGESPFWSIREQALYWIDIEQPALHRFDPATGHDRTWMLPAHIGCFALDDDHRSALVGLRTGLYDLDLATGALRQLAPAPFDPVLFRFNEGARDRTGRFWLGTMFDPLDPAAAEPKQRGTLHAYTPETGLVAYPDFAVIPNGMAWDAPQTTMFLSHTLEGRIYAFAFDPEAGRLGDRRVFATVPKADGAPDGAAMDEHGGYWSALHWGGRLRRFDRDGQPDRDIAMPVSNPTMCTFGGPNLDELYVTTSSKGVKPGHERPLDGALLRCRPGPHGQPPHHP